MKKILFLIYFISFAGLAQTIYIPDSNLKAKLLAASPTSNIAFDDVFHNHSVTIDTNNNGEIEVSEALPILQLSIGVAGINDATGLEAFTNLRWIIISYNNLSSIDFSNLTHLEQIYCHNNPLTTIDVSNLPNLKILFCINTLVTSLDLSNNPVFNQLDCKDNPNLTNINIKNGAQQLFGGQTLYNYCWNNIPNLTNICADDFEIPALQNFYSSNQCSALPVPIISSTCLLNNNEIVLNKISISSNPSSGSFTFNFEENSDFIAINIFDILGKEIYSELIINKKQKTLDLSNFNNGIYFVKITNKDNQVFIKKIIKN